jgi:hypothetical protein
MLADLDTLANRAASGDGRGGKRPGSGRKPKVAKAIPEADKPPFEVRTEDQLLTDGPPPPLDSDKLFGKGDDDHGAIDFAIPVNAAAIYGGAKAREKVAQAAKAELEYRIKIGQYLPRDAVKSALAEAYQAIAQSLRSIPDNLERKLGIPPEVAEVVSNGIDEAMGELAYAMEQIHNKNNDSNRPD